VLALEREHDQDREEQRDQGHGADHRYELLFVPVFASGLQTDEPGPHPGKEGNAEVDKDALGDLPDGNIDHHSLKSEPLRQDRDEEVGVDRKEEHLEDAVEGD